MVTAAAQYDHVHFTSPGYLHGLGIHAVPVSHSNLRKSRNKVLEDAWAL